MLFAHTILKFPGSYEKRLKKVLVRVGGRPGGLWLYSHTVFTQSIRTPLLLNILVLKFDRLLSRNHRMVVNCVDPDQTPHSAASDLGLHCLIRPIDLSEYLGKIRYAKRDVISWSGLYYSARDIKYSPLFAGGASHVYRRKLLK